VANDSALRAIGSKFGKSIEDFATSSKNILEQVVLVHVNEGIKLMRQKITSKVRTGHASTLAERITPLPYKTNDSIGCKTVTDMDYYDYVDKGVQGVYNKTKAVRSPYKFKNLFVPHKMLTSFKDYIARTGSKSMKGKKLIRKNKKVQGDLINAEAKQMAVATKIGGIKPLNYIREADNPKRTKELARGVAKALASGIRTNIVISIKRK